MDKDDKANYQAALGDVRFWRNEADRLRGLVAQARKLAEEWRDWAMLDDDELPYSEEGGDPLFPGGQRSLPWESRKVDKPSTKENE